MYSHAYASSPIIQGRADQAAGYEELSGSDAAILSIADPGTDSRVVLFIPGALDLTCALLRRGVAEATMVRPGCPHRVVDADVAIIPEVHSAEFLTAAIGCARTMLTPLGTITIRLGLDVTEALAVVARRSLLLHGFSAIQTRVTCGNLVIRAELPLYGRLACA